MNQPKEEWLQKTASNLGLKQEDILETTALFIEVAREKIALLQTHGAASYNQAHTVKGSAANLGLTEISKTAEEIETCLKNKQDADILVKKLADEINRLEEYIGD